MEKVTKTHFLRCDYRKVSLDLTIEALSNSIDYLKMKMKELSWYDWGFFIEESEFIYCLFSRFKLAVAKSYR